MAIRIGLKLDDRDFKRRMRRLTEQQAPRVMAKALNRAAFEVIEAEQAEVKKSLSFFGGPGSSTQEFLAGRRAWIPFDGARPERLRAIIEPRPLSRSILERQERGGSFGPEDEVLRLGEFVAVPVGAESERRGRRGKIPATFLPGRALRKAKKGSRRKVKAFRAGDAILQRLPGGGVRVLYALVRRFAFRRRFDFFGTARRTATRVFPEKFRREWEREVGRG